MQIRGDYISYSNSNNTYDHHHHITKCLHEDRHKQPEAAAAGMKSEALSMQKTKEEVKQEPVNIYEDVKKLTDGDKKGTGFFKGIWEAMGEETSKDRAETSPLQSRHIKAGIMAAALTVVRGVIPYGMMSSLANIREKIKVATTSVLKRLGKKEEAFAALTDPKEHFTGKKDADRKFHENKEKGTRAKDGAMITAAAADSHLMDSYSKTGAYCRLNENLTYQKKEALARPGKEPVKDE